MKNGDIQEMSLVDAHIEMILRYEWLDQKCENTFMYFTEGAVFVGVNAVQTAQAWWNDVKADIRALAPADGTVARFNSVICRNLVTDGELGEYAIPDDERTGTRDLSGLGNWVPAFNAGGIRLTVGNTSTRPGQKRFPFLNDTDTEANVLGSVYFDLLETVAAHIDSPLTLGAPVALGVLQPVVGGTVVAGFPTVYQDVVGHVTNPNVTSQISRKKGRGQ